MMINKKMLKEEIERELIGACIIEPENIDFITSSIRTEQIHINNRKIFDEIKYFEISNQTSTEIIIGHLKVLGFEYLAYVKKAALFTISEHTLDFKIKQFHDLRLSLKAEMILKKWLKQARLDSMGLDQLNEIRNEFDEALDTLDIISSEKSLSENITDYLSVLKSENTSKENTGLWSAKFPSFNSFTNGVKEGNLVTVSGAWKQGKTSFGLALVVDYARTRNIAVGIISLEMTERELMDKIISSNLNISYGSLRNPKVLTDSEKEQLEKAHDVFQNSNIFLCTDNLNELQLKFKIRKWVKNKKVKCILVDYIGLLENSKKFNTREQEVSYHSKFLKNLAGELGISIICLAQLNREGEKNPTASNMAESIAMARDSDFVFTIYKPYELNYKSINFYGNEIQVNENQFVIKLANSRHTKQGSQFLVEIINSDMVEVDTKHKCNIRAG